MTEREWIALATGTLQACKEVLTHHYDGTFGSLLAAGNLRRQTDALLSAVPTSGWQPMETAPRNKRILAWTGYSVLIIQWEWRSECWVVADGEDTDVNAKCWTPIPAPPEEKP